MQLKYYVPFSAMKGVEAEQALKEGLLPIEGTAIDESVNANKWQVEGPDLDYLVESLRNAQLRVDHAESALAVIGKVFNAQHVDRQVKFEAEVGEDNIIKKILRGYLTHVSVQVDAETVTCSKCGRQTRKEGLLIHLCPGAWEKVKQPRVRELSIIATPAYETTTFTPAAGIGQQPSTSSLAAITVRPLGFAAAVNEFLRNEKHPEFSESSSEEVTHVGSSRLGTQEPEKQTVSEKEAKPQMSETKEASQKAQGVVNVGPGEQPPKELKYEEFLQKLEPLADQVRKLSEEFGEFKKAEEARWKKFAEEAAEAEEARKKAEEAEKAPPFKKEEEGEEEAEEAEEAKAKGKGIVALEEIPAQRDVLGNVDWFQDLLKAHRKLTEGFK